jgi:hypothetical protein
MPGSERGELTRQAIGVRLIVGRCVVSFDVEV